MTNTGGNDGIYSVEKTNTIGHDGIYGVEMTNTGGNARNFHARVKSN